MRLYSENVSYEIHSAVLIVTSEQMRLIPHHRDTKMVLSFPEKYELNSTAMFINRCISTRKGQEIEWCISSISGSVLFIS